MASFRRLRLAVKQRSTARDYPTLVALLNAAQASGASLRAHSPDIVQPLQPARPDGGDFMNLIEGNAAWRRAILAQAGSFNRDVAARDVPISGDA